MWWCIMVSNILLISMNSSLFFSLLISVVVRNAQNTYNKHRLLGHRHIVINIIFLSEKKLSLDFLVGKRNKVDGTRRERKRNYKWIQQNVFIQRNKEVRECLRERGREKGKEWKAFDMICVLLLSLWRNNHRSIYINLYIYIYKY